MSFLDFLKDNDKLKNMSIADPHEVYSKILKGASGTSSSRSLRYNIFYQIYAFKGVTEGLGTSTLVANIALAIAELGLSVLVIDTSILRPVQDTLLKTNIKDLEDDKILDWFDLPYTKNSVLHESGYNNNISVLSFHNRGVVDALSTNDNDTLVDMAITDFHTKFDIILIDCSHELTSVNTTALQMSQQVIQIWNDAPSVLNNLDMFITNCVTLSCPMDKMRNVVYSKISRQMMGSMDSLLKQYRFKKVTSYVNSEACADVLCLSKPLWQFASTEEDIIAYTNAIIDLVKLILNIQDEESGVGTITSNDIMEGKVEGTLTKKMLDEAENIPIEIVRDIGFEEGDAD